MNTSEPELDENRSACKWLFLLVMFVVNVALVVWAGFWLLASAWDWTVSVLHLAVFLFALFWTVVWDDLLKRA
ncbi:hypothetical protein [Bifidobacterium panos]|uniref:Uncharacterized protein n=1 Tax=Bifidobacterium panos TaxID=2675321 RepID=A0ABX1SYA3_9BIFI|nr:hypothetical protein [Bifidobacterium sp. DSM 109963]NMN02821.1 hypothetical protein [Bifidobacterium sp. DSM 109963]